MKSSTTAGLVLCALLGGACNALPQDRPPEHLSLARHACQEPGLTPVLPPDLQSGMDIPILAGGTVESGDFLISLWLYCDPSSPSDDLESSEYSEIGSLGFRYEWQYLGPYLARATEPGAATVVTANGMVLLRDAPGPPLSHGEIHAHTGSIRTEGQVISRAVASGDPVEFTITISAPDPTASAVLNVTFASAPDGVVLVDARIRQADPH